MKRKSKEREKSECPSPGSDNSQSAVLKTRILSVIYEKVFFLPSSKFLTYSRIALAYVNDYVCKTLELTRFLCRKCTSVLFVCVCEGVSRSKNEITLL